MLKDIFGYPVRKDYFPRPALEFADIFTLEEFEDHVQSGWFTDWDGSAHPVKLIDGKYMESPGYISCNDDVSIVCPEATHIAWYNK